MPRLRAAIAMLLAGALAALALAACGGGAELLAGETAEEIKANLDRVERSAEEGDCTEAEEATAEVTIQVEELRVDSRLKAALEEGVDRLSIVVAECREGEEEVTEPSESTEEEVEPEEEEEKSKPGKEKQQPEQPETEEREEQPEDEEPEETTEAPPTEPEESTSGGVGPSAPAGGE